MQVTFSDVAKTKLISEWREYKDGAKFLVAGIDRPAFRRALEARNLVIEKQIINIAAITDDTPSNVAMFCKAAGRFLLLDWQGIDSPDGKPILYSPDMAEQLCSVSSESASLIEWLTRQAVDIQQQHDTEKEDLVGKSSPSKKPPVARGTQRKPRKSTNTSA